MLPPNPPCSLVRAPRRARQQGAALLIVLVTSLLATLLALWAARAALVNEAIVGNDADYQRAMQAAQALLQDAELDIRGTAVAGVPCGGHADHPKRCRRGIAQQIPRDAAAVARLLHQLDAGNASPPCQAGLCARLTGPQDFWADDAALAGMLSAAARYGEYTGASHMPGGHSNPLLAWSDEGRRGAARAWYWIEVIPYRAGGHASLIEDLSSDFLALHLVPSVIYRITALARGLKSSTQVVLRETYAPTRLRD